MNIEVELDPNNYQAIWLLEKIGNKHPTQAQIDQAEFLVKQRFQDWVNELICQKQTNPKTIQHLVNRC